MEELHAGKLGNLADNLFNRTSGHAHAVRDFIHLSADGASFPAFNFADICVTLGGVMLLITLFRRR